MARLPDLVGFAQRHGLKLGTIADLIAYRRRTERLVARVTETTIDSAHGGAFRMIVYANTVEYAEHIALVKGDIASGGPVPVRMHALNVLTDVLGDHASRGAGTDLHAAMRMIGEEGRGVVVLIREPRPTALSERVARQKDGSPPTLRDYGVGAQILLDLGVREMVLITNHPRSLVGLDGYGLSIVAHRPIPPEGA
jgi:3,4-dihydroxy 2-butanone 4-phosphate synthase/GTP cyclohydrolase II